MLRFFRRTRTATSRGNPMKELLEKLRKEAEKSASELDFIRFQYNQLKKPNCKSVSYRSGNRIGDIEYIETIKTALSRISMIFDEDQGTLTQLREVEDT